MSRSARPALRPDTLRPAEPGPLSAQGPANGLRRRSLCAGMSAAMVAGLGAAAWPLAAPAQELPARWSRLQIAARGRTVHFNAWGGSERINAYLQWVAAEVQRLHGVTLVHVKIADAAEVVQRVRAEKQAGRSPGSVDLVWINGENFLTMKREGLLVPGWTYALPAYAAVDTVGKPTTLRDFGEPVDGHEAPWGMAQLTFFADGRKVPQPPQSLDELIAWARRNPGRFSYPRPPQFHGTTFLKQVLLEAVPDRAPFDRPFDATAPAEAFQRLTAPLWARLDALHPSLWREGRQFPAQQATLRQMVADGELWIGLTFNPNEAAGEIASQGLPPSTLSYQHRAGTVGNTHFVAIPFNATTGAAAQVVANFLMSPAAQARKADVRHWGDPTVLALDRLSADERALFGAAAAPGQVTQPAPAWLEPHGSWVEPLEREWLRRYGQ